MQQVQLQRYYKALLGRPDSLMLLGKVVGTFDARPCGLVSVQPHLVAERNENCVPASGPNVLCTKNEATTASLVYLLEQIMRHIIIALGISSFALAGCSDDTDFALLLLEPTIERGQELQLIAATTELGAGIDPTVTHEEAAIAMKTATETEIPCADVTVSGATVTIEYGAKEGACSLHGMTLTGTHTMTMRTEIYDPNAGKNFVDHKWTNVSDGRTTISGSGLILRDGTKELRTAQFLLDPDEEFENLCNGEWTVTASMDTAAFLVHGSASMGNCGGTTFYTTDAEFRWGDPAPQSGSLRIAHPRTTSSSGTAEDTILYERINETTIQARVMKFSPPDVFHIALDGTITRVH